MTGETIVVKDAKGWEDKRVRALATAVEGVRAGQYPAQPETEHFCASCPFWMVCPA